MAFNLISFGETLRKKRSELKLTIEDVSKLAGVSSQTVGRIEAGKVIPKIETLEFLSLTYKDDLLSIFLDYRLTDYSYFYEIRDRLEAKLDSSELDSIHVELGELKVYIEYVSNLYYKNLISQLILLTEAIIIYRKDNDYTHSMNILIYAIKLTTPTFTINNYDFFVYSLTEIRILMNISLVLNKLGNKDYYLEITKFCLSSVDSTDRLYPRFCHNLAGVYQRTQQYEKALEYSTKGIEACKKIRDYGILPTLYYGKGIAEFKLFKEGYMKPLNISIALCEVFEQIDLKNKIINNCREVFGIYLSYLV